jgi:hypothetical protein
MNYVLPQRDTKGITKVHKGVCQHYQFVYASLFFISSDKQLINHPVLLPPLLQKLILHHIFANKISFENLFRPWRSLDSSTQHLQISVNERGGFARDDNRLRENNGKKEVAIRNKNFSIFERFRSNRRFFLPSYTQKTCHPETHPPLGSFLKHWICGG